MYQVLCPKCKKTRMITAKKKWMEGEPPFNKICKSCCQIGKPKTEKCKKKLSEVIKKIQTPDVIQKKREFMNSHPELWVVPRPDLARNTWTGMHHTEESKLKISMGVKQAKSGEKNE